MTAATPSTAPPVVLLHGVGLDKSVWTDLEELLKNPTVPLDLPGHGEQPALTSPVTLAGLSDDVVARMPEEPVHLVGFSLGSLIAMDIAIRFPEKVLSLTCVNSVCDRTPEESASVRERLTTASVDFDKSMERALNRWFPEDTPENRELRDRTARVLMANDVQSYLYAYAVFAEADREIAPALSQISVPTLAITGGLDPGSTPAMSYRIGSRIPSARVQIVPDAHHMLPATHPEVLATSLHDLFNITERNV